MPDPSSLLIARVHGVAVRGAELTEAAQELAAAARAQEGCLSYDVLAEPGATAELVLMGAWRTDAAMRAHFASGAYGRYVDGGHRAADAAERRDHPQRVGHRAPAPGPVARAGEGELMATTVMRSERFPDLGDEVLFPRLSDGKIAWFAKHGERRTFQPGEVLYEHAVRDAPFYVIDHGRVEFVDRKPGKDIYVARGRQPHVHRRHRGLHRRADDQRLRGRRADRRDRVRPRRAARRWSRAGRSSASTSSARCWRGARGTRPRATASCA